MHTDRCKPAPHRRPLRARMRLLPLLLLTGAAPAWAAGDDAGEARVAGVDLENRVLTVGVLNDESGPAAAIGRPDAIGKRRLAEQVNAGRSGLLPEGWTVRLVERDHGYNPQRSVQAYMGAAAEETRVH